MKYVFTIALVALHLVDIATTRFLFNMGVLEHGGIELNPLMENMIMTLDGFMLKMFVVIAVCYLYLTKSISNKIMIFCVVVSLLVVLGNLYAVALYLWVV